MSNFKRDTIAKGSICFKREAIRKYKYKISRVANISDKIYVTVWCCSSGGAYAWERCYPLKDFLSKFFMRGVVA